MHLLHNPNCCFCALMMVRLVEDFCLGMGRIVISESIEGYEGHVFYCQIVDKI